ncbi:MAG: hypothetical protein ACYDAD_14615, partial [Acidimicrobiales bacterium]
FDPDEGDVPEPGRSEITRSIAFQRRVASDPARDDTRRLVAATNADRLERTVQAHVAGEILTIDLTVAELEIVGRLTSPSGCKAFGLVFPLDAGEAACIAVAVTRSAVLATDDGDALKALRTLAPSHPYERIRKLLIRAGNGGHISPDRANEIHAEMRQLGFWDTEPPFPN